MRLWKDVGNWQDIENTCMKNISKQSICILLLLFLATVNEAQKKSNVAADIYANVVKLELDKEIVFSGCSRSSARENIVQVSTQIQYAPNADGEGVKIDYHITIGELIGEGNPVMWDLTDASPGRHKITAIANDNGCNCSDSQTRFVYVIPCAEDQALNRSWKINLITVGIGAKHEQSRKLLKPHRKNDLFNFLSRGLRRLFRIEEVSNDLVNQPPLVSNLSFQKNFDLSLCERRVRNENCEIDGSKILVMVQAIDPENDPIDYSYKTSAGVIVGNGAKIIWDLSNEKPGRYAIEVCADDGSGCTFRQNQASAQVLVTQAEKR